MGRYQTERERSTLRDLMRVLDQSAQPLTRQEIAAKSGYTEVVCWRILDEAIKRGFVMLGEKKRICLGKGNRRKTYVRAPKKLPRPKPVTPKTEQRKKIDIADRERIKRAEEALKQPAFRHPLDIAFYGEYQRKVA